ncbi:MAG: hypothetical protein SGARI_002239 [Bacillariaceae sp.]
MVAFLLAQREQDRLISTEDHQRNVARKDDNLCRLHPNVPALSDVDIHQLWDDACSMMIFVKHIFGADGAGNLHASFSSSVQENLCCEFGPHNPWTYLRLPALEEPAIRLQIPFGGENASSQLEHFTLDLEQDGFLRTFQVDSVLWPSGYLLSLCMGNLRQCVPETRDLHQKRSHVTALELGCGIGAPSIALAKHLSAKNTTTASIVATDFSPYARLLTESNAYYNHVANFVHTAAMDHFNNTSMEQVVQQYSHGDGVDVIYGSSLQGLFVDTHKDDSPLWLALGILLRSDGLAVFAHTRNDDDKLQAPLSSTSKSNSFELLYCKSGSEPMFGPMTTRHGEESDFEICVFRRRRRRRNEDTTAAEL